MGQINGPKRSNTLFRKENVQTNYGERLYHIKGKLINERGLRPVGYHIIKIEHLDAVIGQWIVKFFVPSSQVYALRPLNSKEKINRLMNR